MSAPLLTSDNPKIAKQVDELGILPLILHLAPADISGMQVCYASSAGCRAACLFWSGNGFRQSVQDARIRKTREFFHDRAWFLGTLVREIADKERDAMNSGRILAVRLNGTSDLLWETFPVIRDGVTYPNIMTAFPAVEFYDYTKMPGRRNLPANYHLTFSLSEDNDRVALANLARGRSVAVVFESSDFPTEWGGYPVINGDAHDFRFLDPDAPHIVALSAKGHKGKADRTGFVRSTDGGFDPTRKPSYASQRTPAPVAMAAD